MWETPDDLNFIAYYYLKPKAAVKESMFPPISNRLISEGLDIPMIELVHFHNIVKEDRDLEIYFLALLILKASRESPLNDDVTLELCNWVVYFVELCPNYVNAIKNSFGPAIRQEISRCSPEDLINWGNTLKMFEDKGIHFEVAKQWFKIKYSAELFAFSPKMQSNPNKQNMKQAIEFIKLGRNLDIDIKNVEDIILTLLCDLIIDQNDLKGTRNFIGEHVNKDLVSAAEIISELKVIQNLEDDIKNTITFIEIQLAKKGEFGVINQDFNRKAPRAYISHEDLKLSPINLNDLKFENFTLYAATTEELNVTVHRGKSSDGSLVVVKSYKALKSVKVLDLVEEEIKILTIVSNRASPKNCFLKFYWVHRQEDSIYLYMEAGEANLMATITRWRDKKYFPDIKLLEEWIVSLIDSFVELSYIGIYHQDIKPHNIVVTNDNKLKIIDFSVSKIYEQIEVTSCPTRGEAIQGTNGYMAPEIEEMNARGQHRGNFKPGKADVFSLGMTILQLMTYEQLATLNIAKENQKLMELVETVRGPNWIKVLLRNMLHVNRKIRPSFHKCLRYVPRELTNTRAPSN